MPAKHHIDHDTRLLMTTWEGDAVDVEFIESLKNYQQEFQSDPELVAYNEVANFCDISSIKVTPGGLKNMSEVAAATDQYKSGNKLAIVVSSGVAFNLARLYASYRNLQNSAQKEIRIFKSEEEAIEWARSSE